MKLQALLAAAALTVAAAGTAQACPMHDKQAMSCAEGHVWDKDAHSCVPTTG
jgi:hypothetical protein